MSDCLRTATLRSERKLRLLSGGGMRLVLHCRSGSSWDLRLRCESSASNFIHAATHMNSGHVRRFFFLHAPACSCRLVHLS